MSIPDKKWPPTSTFPLKSNNLLSFPVVRFFKTILISLALPLCLAASTLDNAKSSAEADLENALERFSTLQNQIKEEKIPLSRELADLKSEVSTKRREAERSRRLRDNSSLDLNQLEQRVEMRLEQLDYVANLIADFGERFERDIALPEQQLYKPEIDRFSQARDSMDTASELGKVQRLIDQLFILETSIGRFDDLVGGQIFEGRAVVGTGDLETGQFMVLGPESYFASNVSETAGQTLRAGIMPPLVSISTEADRQIRQTILNGGVGDLPMDPTLGSALAISAEQDTIVEHIMKGGLWIWPILFFAFVSLIVAVFKFFEIYAVKMPEPGVLHDILVALNDNDREKAMGIAQSVVGPTRAMLVDAVEHSNENKELVEEVMYERMLEVQPKLERLLPFIAVTAATAPLLGLLGTVTGMINTFKLITIFGTGDAKSLSSGISEALITTEFGLIVAIPSLIIHSLLRMRSQRVMASMERMAVTFINGLVRKN